MARRLVLRGGATVAFLVEWVEGGSLGGGKGGDSSGSVAVVGESLCSGLVGLSGASMAGLSPLLALFSLGPL